MDSKTSLVVNASAFHLQKEPDPTKNNNNNNQHTQFRLFPPLPDEQKKTV
jgi:hypothetical protein